MSACLALEQKLRIAYLGPAGTFSHAAVARHFGDFVDAEPYASIDEVFRAAESGQTDYAVVPVENSTEGAVGRTLDLMCQTELDDRRRDQAAHRPAPAVQARASLGRRSRASIRTRNRSRSALQWLRGICRRCRAFPSRATPKRRDWRRRAGRRGDRRRNRGGHLRACRRWRRISRTSPTTRRASGSWDARRSRRPGSDETSLVMSAHNRPGAVHALLEPFAKHGVSMTRLESRPARTGLWEYLFFVDVEGHRDDAAGRGCARRTARSARRSSSCSVRIPRRAGSLKRATGRRKRR